MLYFKCKYYHACGSFDNCACCREKPKQIKKDVEKMVKYLHTRGISVERR